MGSVWLAEHLTLHTRVAVKFISADLARDSPDVVGRFQREASSSAQIKSLYVVQVFDHGITDEGAPYIVMEYLEGESLGDRLERTGIITMRQTAQVLVQVGKALDRAHELGIVHRDIKPDNVFLSTADEGMICKVLDFGIAKHTKLADQKGQTLPGTTVGTPEYMSRELVMTARDVDASADRWALAVVAYQCLTGILPFDGPTLGMVCVAICTGKYEAPTSLCDDLPPEVDQWFERALHKDKAQRFGSCKEMALDFLRLVPKVAEEDSWAQSGEFSLPPPNSSRAAALGQIQLGGVEGAGSVPQIEAPPSSGAMLRMDTPTFNGAAAELGGAPATRRWRPKAVGAIGAVVLLVAGLGLGLVLSASDGAETVQPASTGAQPDGSSYLPAPTATAQPAATATASSEHDEDAGAPSPDASASASAPATTPSWRPRPRPTRGPGSTRPRDLGF
jgi:serine/threonine-protein kinase